MCGLLYIQDRMGNAVNHQLLDRYEAQKQRGQEGFGLFDGKRIVRATKEKKMLKFIQHKGTDFALFHHRMPTSTANVKSSAHPFSTKQFFGDTQYILVHNGKITNARSRKEAHNDLGIEYQSLQANGDFNDSEALLWDFALKVERGIPMDKIYGDIAFICVKTVKGTVDTLYFGRNYARPMVMQRSKHTLLLASEGEGERVEADMLYRYNYRLNRLTRKPMRFFCYDSTYKVSKYDGRYDDGYGDSYTPGSFAEQQWKKYRKKYGYGGQKQLPRGKKQRPSDRELTTEEIEEQLESYMPKLSWVIKLLDSYLMRSHGHYEQCYVMLEDRYDEVASRTPTVANVKYSLLLEQAMQRLQADPFYLDEDSVHPDYVEYWQHAIV
jgi:predicted glutamine amidotransferase